MLELIFFKINILKKKINLKNEKKSYSLKKREEKSYHFLRCRLKEFHKQNKGKDTLEKPKKVWRLKKMNQKINCKILIIKNNGCWNEIKTTFFKDSRYFPMIKDGMEIKEIRDSKILWKNL